MSVEVACQCDGLPSHSHVGRWTRGDKDNPYLSRYEETGEVRIWVDWKAVARALSQETTPREAVNDAE